MNKEGYQPMKTTVKPIPPNTGSNVHMKEDGYTWKDLDKSYWEGFDNAKNKMEKRVEELELTNNKLKEQLALRYDLEDKIQLLEQENAFIKSSDSMCKLIGEQKIKIKELEKKLTEKVTLESLDVVSARIEELTKENAGLKSELTKKADTNHSLVKQMATLESENAELKAKNKWYSEQVCNKECAEVWGNLTKATEIIKKMYYLYFDPCVTHKDLENRDELFEEVKQFLKADVGTKNYEEQDKILKTRLL